MGSLFVGFSLFTLAGDLDREKDMKKFFILLFIISICMGSFWAGCSKDENQIEELSVYCVDIWDTKAARVTRYCGTEETGDVEISKHRKKTMVIMKNPTKEIIDIPISPEGRF